MWVLGMIMGFDDVSTEDLLGVHTCTRCVPNELLFDLLHKHLWHSSSPSEGHSAGQQQPSGEGGHAHTHTAGRQPYFFSHTQG